MYGIYLTHDDYVAVVNYEDYDYKREKFFVNEYGDHLIFYSENEALEWLHEHVIIEKIHPLDKGRKAKFIQSHYMK